MAIHFFDSSALVKAYRREIGTPRVLELLDGADPLAISNLAHVEVSSAIIRRARAAGISQAEFDSALAELDREVSQSFHLIDLDDSIIARAVELTRRHGLRGADAIQLACAIGARDIDPRQQVIFVASDQELNAAAVTEGFAVVDPAQNSGTP